MTFLIYILSLGAILSGWKVISSSKNPVHSILFLVLAFANASILLLILGVEYLAILFIIVYVGAIAILFLFVIMMLNIKLVEILDNTTRYKPIGAVIGSVFLIELLLLVSGSNKYDFEFAGLQVSNQWSTTQFGPYFEYETILNNIASLGSVLYTDYYQLLLISGYILLVAMIGAIVLTLYHEKNIKRQDIFSQISSDFSNTIR